MLATNGRAIKRRTTKGRKFHPEVLSQKEISRLLLMISSMPKIGLRDSALVVLLWRGALRLNEALSLTLKDVDLARAEVLILVGKGGESRRVGLDPLAVAYIHRWIRHRHAHAGTDLLFCTSTGRQVLSQHYHNLLPRAARAVGIEKRVHPHCFRHTCAFEMAQEGVPMHMIQKHLGHANLGTTARYVNHLNPVEVIQMNQRRLWTDELEPTYSVY